jgi:hypothetical protein
MTEPQKAPAVKTIVVPRALEDFFAEKLRRRYADRDDVQIVIDRRSPDRRDDLGDQSAVSPQCEKERRLLAGWWSLPDLPFETKKAS